MNKVAPIEKPEADAQLPAVTRQPKPPLVAGAHVAPIVPRDMDEMFRLARAVCVSGMVPDSYRGKTDEETAAKVCMGIQKGLEVGLPPIAALSGIYIVNNRPSLWGDAALALVQNHQDFAGCVETINGKPETDAHTATCTIKRKVGDDINTTTRTFSWADAKRAALTNKVPWRQYPQRMLQMRARAWCIRDSFADALSGLGIKEELDDIAVKPEGGTDATFLDVGETISIPQISTAAEIVQHEQESGTVENPADQWAEIQKWFIAAGDDKDQNAKVIAMAEGFELPEPFKTDLAEIISVKKARFNIR
jgi:hypothetical protein